MADSLTHFITAQRFLKGRTFSPRFIQGFTFGVHGPDIFFFAASPEAFALGDRIHDSKPGPLFETKFSELPRQDDLYQGYAYGVLLHYFEDRIMHQYVGYIRRKYNDERLHGICERQFDVSLYRREYGKPITSFSMDRYYKVDESLCETAFRYWQDRVQDPLLTRELVSRGLWNMVSMVKLMARPNALIKFSIWLRERREGKPGEYMFRFDTSLHEEHMNLDHQVWESQNGPLTLSVPDILDKGVADFEAEYTLIQELLRDHKPYEFAHSETFSWGK
jgi:hypothetical protein